MFFNRVYIELKLKSQRHRDTSPSFSVLKRERGEMPLVVFHRAISAICESTIHHLCAFAVVYHFILYILYVLQIAQGIGFEHVFHHPFVGSTGG